MLAALQEVRNHTDFENSRHECEFFIKSHYKTIYWLHTVSLMSFVSDVIATMERLEAKCSIFQ